jgi:hypothetical protein
MRRLAAALLLLTAASCRRVQPEALYAQGREAMVRGDLKAAEQIARDGERRFAAKPEWHELFAILEAESVVRTDSVHARTILKQTPATGAPMPAIRRLMTQAALQPKEANELYANADALAARAVPQLRPEIAIRRILLFDRDIDAIACGQQAIKGAAALDQKWVIAASHNFLGTIEARKGRWAGAIGHYGMAL